MLNVITVLTSPYENQGAALIYPVIKNENRKSTVSFKALEVVAVNVIEQFLVELPTHHV